MASITTAVLNGGVGGLIATAVMTAVMMGVGDGSPPPTAQLWSKYVGGEPEENKAPAMLLHFFYGTLVGAVLVVALGYGGLTGAVTSFGAAVAYGVLLFVVGAVFWMRTVLGIEPEKKQVIQFFVLHLVYGGVLGGWIAAGVI
ncbi:MAG: hypothetical protein SV760_04825 [Halobacteria archaeon]|nr:hypothetical protein [Halobacteria archaeon]